MLSHDRLFHDVLRLEQELTTGGGWQDQIGGSIGGLKLVTTKAGMVPEATIRYVPADILDPRINGGQTLLYYTGVTRLAKNILQNVVGRYLDRDRQAMSALGQLAGLASRMAEAMGPRTFGFSAGWSMPRGPSTGNSIPSRALPKSKKCSLAFGLTFAGEAARRRRRGISPADREVENRRAAHHQPARSVAPQRPRTLLRLPGQRLGPGCQRLLICVLC